MNSFFDALLCADIEIGAGLKAEDSRVTSLPTMDPLVGGECLLCP